MSVTWGQACLLKMALPSFEMHWGSTVSYMAPQTPGGHFYLWMSAISLLFIDYEKEGGHLIWPLDWHHSIFVYFCVW